MRVFKPLRPTDNEPVHPCPVALMKRLVFSLSAYSVWNALVAALMLGWQWRHYAAAGPAQADVLISAALALFHVIYAIWFWKGRALPAFARASVPGRLLMAVCYLAAAWYRQQAAAQPDTIFEAFFRSYLLVQGLADLLGALLTLACLRGLAERPDIQPPLQQEGRNRGIFAFYMVLLSLWLLLDGAGFSRFFHLPVSAAALSPAPLQVLGAQVMLLAFYNVVAVRYRLLPLIEAGIRGGLFTCVFMVLLVLLGVLSPRVLLPPLVDLISVGWLLLQRLPAWQMRRG